MDISGGTPCSSRVEHPASATRPGSPGATPKTSLRGCKRKPLSWPARQSQECGLYATARARDMHFSNFGMGSVITDGAGTGTASLSLSRGEALLLKDQLSRDLARLEDELARAREGHSVLVERVQELRRLDLRLRQLIQSFEPLPDMV
jgi:hypothetical protein